jgi:hypothetical protein
MIVTRLKLPLDEVEYSALLEIAGIELRNPTDQAHMILRREFERRRTQINEPCSGQQTPVEKPKLAEARNGQPD